MHLRVDAWVRHPGLAVLARAVAVGRPVALQPHARLKRGAHDHLREELRAQRRVRHQLAQRIGGLLALKRDGEADEQQRRRHDEREELPAHTRGEPRLQILPEHVARIRRLLHRDGVRSVAEAQRLGLEAPAQAAGGLLVVVQAVDVALLVVEDDERRHDVLVLDLHGLLRQLVPLLLHLGQLLLRLLLLELVREARPHVVLLHERASRAQLLEHVLPLVELADHLAVRIRHLHLAHPRPHVRRLVAVKRRVQHGLVVARLVPDAPLAVGVRVRPPAVHDVPRPPLLLVRDLLAAEALEHPVGLLELEEVAEVLLQLVRRGVNGQVRDVHGKVVGGDGVLVNLVVQGGDAAPEVDDEPDERGRVQEVAGRDDQRRRRVGRLEHAKVDVRRVAVRHGARRRVQRLLVDAKVGDRERRHEQGVHLLLRHAAAAERRPQRRQHHHRRKGAPIHQQLEPQEVQRHATAELRQLLGADGRGVGAALQKYLLRDALHRLELVRRHVVRLQELVVVHALVVVLALERHLRELRLRVDRRVRLDALHAPHHAL
mmetsp:Transcript_2973/g.10621  ORF Transcript_2973/g.10621 Transcript_2973/m.10621 type:complete len:545 (+) Transcript_2973:1713-3347(+)